MYPGSELVSKCPTRGWWKSSPPPTGGNSNVHPFPSPWTGARAPACAALGALWSASVESWRALLCLTPTWFFWGAHPGRGPHPPALPGWGAHWRLALEPQQGSEQSTGPLERPSEVRGVCSFQSPEESQVLPSAQGCGIVMLGHSFLSECRWGTILCYLKLSLWTSGVSQTASGPLGAKRTLTRV